MENLMQDFENIYRLKASKQLIQRIIFINSCIRDLIVFMKDNNINCDELFKTECSLKDIDINKKPTNLLQPAFQVTNPKLLFEDVDDIETVSLEFLELIDKVL